MVSPEIKIIITFSGRLLISRICSSLKLFWRCVVQKVIYCSKLTFGSQPIVASIQMTPSPKEILLLLKAISIETKTWLHEKWDTWIFERGISFSSQLCHWPIHTAFLFLFFFWFAQCRGTLMMSYKRQKFLNALYRKWTFINYLVPIYVRNSLIIGNKPCWRVVIWY